MKIKMKECKPTMRNVAKIAYIDVHNVCSTLEHWEYANDYNNSKLESKNS